MRVTGGEFCGRTLKVPKSAEIRPTQDRVRQALFNILRETVVGADFLDLFAGSGSVGLEALSRGARAAVFVESNRRHLAVLKENLAMLPSGRAACTRTVSADAYAWVAAYSGPGFDIAFADPPYALGEARGHAPLLASLAARQVVRPGGLFVAEAAARQELQPVPGWELLRDRLYGKTRLCLWRAAASLAVAALLCLPVHADESADDGDGWYAAPAAQIVLPQGGARTGRLAGGALRAGCYVTGALALEGEAAWLENTAALAARAVWHLHGWQSFDRLFGYERFDPFLSFGARGWIHHGQLGPSAGIGAFWYLTDAWALRFDADATLGLDTRAEAAFALSAGVQYFF